MNLKFRVTSSISIPLIRWQLFNVFLMLTSDVFRVTKVTRSSPWRISLAPACQLMTHVTTNFRLNRDQCIWKLAVACLDKSIYFNNIYMNIHHKLMETFGKYSGAPSELWDLTREFTTFCLSEASLQKTRRCYSCVFMGRSDKLTWQLTVLIYIYLPLGQNHSTDSLLIGKRAPSLSGMCANTMVSWL